jgi:hypothetical protein
VNEKFNKLTDAIETENIQYLRKIKKFYDLDVDELLAESAENIGLIIQGEKIIASSKNSVAFNLT